MERVWRERTCTLLASVCTVLTGLTRVALAVTA
jgi:hypothetical protein